MHVSSHTLRLALSRIFADAGARAADGLDFPEILQSWSDTGLRESDLHAAVHEMLESNDLRRVERNGVPGLALETHTSCTLIGPDGELRISTLEDETTLLHARYRGDEDPAAERRQRAEDSTE
jgi:hypothetical protein